MRPLKKESDKTTFGMFWGWIEIQCHDRGVVQRKETAGLNLGERKKIYKVALN